MSLSQALNQFAQNLGRYLLRSPNSIDLTNTKKRGNKNPQYQPY